MNKLVIFDLDGVLFESRDMHFKTLNRALVEYGYPPISPEDHLARFNGLPTTLKLEMLGITGEDADAIRSNKQAFTLGWVYKNVKENEMFQHLFDNLHTREWKVAVCSNAITMTVQRALQLLGLWDKCDFVIAADRGFTPKPDPAMYLRCMEVCGSDPANTIIVEDSPVGQFGAAATGAKVVMVAGPHEVLTRVARAVSEPL
jgi:HAD superfamily hydrolase (TIGR01509 family)